MTVRPKNATAMTIPNGLTVVYTYNGSTSAPINIGTYQVVGLVSDNNYFGGATNSFVIVSGISNTPTNITAHCLRESTHHLLAVRPSRMDFAGADQQREHGHNDKLGECAWQRNEHPISHQHRPGKPHGVLPVADAACAGAAARRLADDFLRND